ncbi:MAG: glutamate-5-semialdehyde dehydrogenase [Actinobacteria bacterium]|nr:glutamate-5-semialdehyde dehydrogenase [Actinomycetota bacterium]
MTYIEGLAKRAREASAVLAVKTAMEKNAALTKMAGRLTDNTDEILKWNEKDLNHAEEEGITGAILDRLTLTDSRIEEMADGLRKIAELRDPVGEIVDGWTLPNGLYIQKVRVPMGVVGIIYEARPNVTVDAAGLCLKSGNAVILRGSSSAINSNKVLTDVIAGAAGDAGLPDGAIQLVESTDRDSARELMKMHGLVDVLIPRGGADLIKTVVENSSVPVIETGIGNCHIYVDEDADIDMAVAITVNSKTDRPGVCNACETLLVSKVRAVDFLTRVRGPLEEKGVELRGCEKTRDVLDGIKEATEDDWYAEYLDLVLAVKVVDNVDEAIAHINMYGSGHSECIVTKDYDNSRKFTAGIDSSTVYVNASTRFTDGAQFGMGAEIGISTQKLHARGPMSLPELTTTKFVVLGDGQIRE